MIKRFFILTKSYKKGGYCVAGIDLVGKCWIRPVNSDDPETDRIERSQLKVGGRELETFDIVEVDLIKNIPNNCQSENWLVNQNYRWKYCGEGRLFDYINGNAIEKTKYFITNKGCYITENAEKRLSRSLFLFCVNNFRVSAKYDLKYKYKCSFEYNGIEYEDISLTDPVYRDIEKDGIVLRNALIVASLPCVPHVDGFYYKFVAKVIEINEEEADLLNAEMKSSEILKSVANSVNPFTGEKIEGVDNKLRKELYKIVEKIEGRQQYIPEPNDHRHESDAITFVEQDGFKLVASSDGEILTDMGLLKILRSKRYEISVELERPAYTVITNRGLVSLATYFPKTKEEFVELYGLGEKSYNEFGEIFIDIIKEYKGKK